MKSTFAKFFMGAMVIGSLAAQAGTTVCSGKTLHYSNYQADFGAVPPKGTYSGERFVSYKGELLAKQEFRIGVVAVGDWDVNVKFSNHKGIASEGTPVFGWNIYEATLQVVELNTPVVEPIQERVVCKTTWAMVP